MMLLIKPEIAEFTQLTFEIKKGTYVVGNSTRKGNSVFVTADSPTQCVLKCNLKSMKAFYSTNDEQHYGVGRKCVCLHPGEVEADIKFDGGVQIEGGSGTDSTNGLLYEQHVNTHCPQKGLFFFFLLSSG